jgi:acyl carrier protein
MTSSSINETAQRVLSIIEDHLSKKLSDAARLVDDLGLDSLEVVDLALELEQRLQVDFPDEVIERLETVDDVIRHVTELMSESPRNPSNA